jgi:hypothetical protein
MKFKNLLAIILSLALVLTLTACDGASGGNNQGGEDTAPVIPNLSTTEETPMSEDNNQDEESTPFASASVGDVIQFGAFDWRVLEIQDDKALIISEDIIEHRPYHVNVGDITWEHSTIRQYLNGEFYNSFSSAEQERIVETTIINNDNPIHGTAGGNDTTDNIFLLSIDEAEMYFPNDTSRIALNADGEASWWWLRSPGFSSISAADVIDYGDVNVGGNFVDIDNGGVRPALWLNL